MTFGSCTLDAHIYIVYLSVYHMNNHHPIVATLTFFYVVFVASFLPVFFAHVLPQPWSLMIGAGTTSLPRPFTCVGGMGQGVDYVFHHTEWISWSSRRVQWCTSGPWSTEVIFLWLPRFDGRKCVTARVLLRLARATQRALPPGVCWRKVPVSGLRGCVWPGASTR